MYPSPPDITNMEGGLSVADTLSTTGPDSWGALVAADNPPLPGIAKKNFRSIKFPIEEKETFFMKTQGYFLNTILELVSLE